MFLKEILRIAARWQFCIVRIHTRDRGGWAISVAMGPPSFLRPLPVGPFSFALRFFFCYTAEAHADERTVQEDEADATGGGERANPFFPWYAFRSLSLSLSVFQSPRPARETGGSFKKRRAKEATGREKHWSEPLVVVPHELSAGAVRTCLSLRGSFNFR